MGDRLCSPGHGSLLQGPSSYSPLSIGALRGLGSHPVEKVPIQESGGGGGGAGVGGKTLRPEACFRVIAMQVAAVVVPVT